MIIFSLIIFLILVLALGWLVLFFWPEIDRQAILPTSFIIGGGLISLQLFIAKFLFKLMLGNWCVWLILIEVLALFYWHHKRGKRPIPNVVMADFFSKTDLFLITLIAGVVVLSLVRVWTNPLVTYDALAVWAYRVKVLIYHQSDFFNPNTVSFWANTKGMDYPWHLSFLGWLQSHLMGGVKDTLLNFLPWCYFVMLLSAVYSMAKEKLSRMWSLALVLSVATLPLIFYHSYNFYADLPLATYLAVILLVWRRWLVNKSGSTLLLVTVLSGLTVLVKYEAIFFIGCLFLVSGYVVWRENKSIKSLWPFLVAIALTGPWYLWKIINYKLANTASIGWSWHPEVTNNIFSTLFVSQSWHIWWYILIVMLVITWTKVRHDKNFLYGLIWFSLSLLVFLGLYYFTYVYQFVVDNTAVGRNFILFIPLSLGLLIDALDSWFKDA